MARRVECVATELGSLAAEVAELGRRFALLLPRIRALSAPPGPRAPPLPVEADGGRAEGEEVSAPLPAEGEEVSAPLPAEAVGADGGRAEAGKEEEGQSAVAAMLPLEVLLLIFRWLPLREVIERCGNVCALWSAAVGAEPSGGTGVCAHDRRRGSRWARGWCCGRRQGSSASGHGPAWACRGCGRR